MEKIGQVFLDDTLYPGQDLYSDGKIEEELHEIARESREEEWNQVIAERKSWPILYHFSHIRENIVNWIPFTGEEHVLEIGSGCGAITGALCRRAKSVTCIELSKKRSEINAWKHRDYDNLTILLGNFQDVEKTLTEQYDYITLIGVFEYGGAYIQSETPYVDFLKIVASHLKPNGKIVLAIENRFGLKYWAGCTEDHFGTLYEGLEGYPSTNGIKTFTKKEFGQILEEAGNLKASWYYPFPDYKFPMTIYSDRRLPKKGELNRTEYNFDRLRLQLFEESAVYDSLLDNDLYPEFSNSFLLMIGKEDCQKQETVLYAHFANERAAKYQAQVELREENGVFFAERKAMTKAAVPQIQKLPEFEKELQKVYQAEGFLVNHCLEAGEDRVRMEYLEGKTLEEKLDEYLKQGQDDLLEQELFEFIDTIRRLHEELPFESTERFQEIFGKQELPEGLRCGKITNLDLVPANLICTAAGKYVIDYEWTFSFPIPCNFLVYRILHYYVNSDAKRNRLLERDLYQKAGISQEEMKLYPQMEESFQTYILADHVPMRNMYADISLGKVNVEEYYHKIHFSRQDKSRILQIFWGPTQAFSKERSMLLPMKKGKNRIHFTLPEDAVYLRLDPGEEAGRFRIGKLRCEDYGKNCIYVPNHGIRNEKKEISFFADPQILAGPLPKGCRSFSIELEKLSEKEEEDGVIQECLEGMNERMHFQEAELARLKQELARKEQLIQDMENTKVWKMYQKIKHNK